MNIEQLITELSALGHVGYCDLIEGTDNKFAISIEGVLQNQETLDTFNNIIESYVKPTYQTIDVLVIESGSIKAVFI